MRVTRGWAMGCSGLLAATLIAACSGDSSSPTPTLYVIPTALELSPTGAPSAETSDHSSGPCDHLLWPLADGSTWTYRYTAADGSSHEVTLGSVIEPAGIVLSLEGSTNHLNCLDGGLSGLLPGFIGSGHPDLGGSVHGTNPRGMLLPPSADLLPLGETTSWDIELDAAGTINLPLTGTHAGYSITSGRIVLYHSTSPVIDVTVPAGTFTALPVRQDLIYEIMVEAPDGSQQVLINAGVELYYAEGVGLIRVEFEGGTISSPSGGWPLSADGTLELLSYTLE